MTLNTVQCTTETRPSLHAIRALTIECAWALGVNYNLLRSPNSGLPGPVNQL
jgi:hypothetical protein